MFEFRTHESIRDIDATQWERLRAGGPPHLAWAFLSALEDTGCAKPEAGWYPVHVTLHQDGKLVATAPAYVKAHSDGEFVFDHSWARFAYQELGIDYYPKLIVAIPFTPATGPRLLVDPAVDGAAAHRALVAGLHQFTERVGLSGVHVLLPATELAPAFAETGLMERHGLQYHWHNAGYESFDDFLDRFPAKRRHQIRRERRELEKQGVELEVLTGSDIDREAASFAYDFYCSTVDKYYWGQRYLNAAFFEQVCGVMKDDLLIVAARDRASGRRIAGAFNLLGPRTLYGRYWGALEERPFLHFNVCYYQGIEECIRRGLTVFEPGAGGGHKLARGFVPTITHSFHHLRDPRLAKVVGSFLERERRAVAEHVQSEGTVFRCD